MVLQQKKYFFAFSFAAGWDILLGKGEFHNKIHNDSFSSFLEAG